MDFAAPADAPEAPGIPRGGRKRIRSGAARGGRDRHRAADPSAARLRRSAHRQARPRRRRLSARRRSTSSASPALPSASNIVPIRPGALDALSPREPPHGFPAESVELTRSERDAFREIARALVGRTPASRDESPGERAELTIVAPGRAVGRAGRRAGLGRPAPTARRFGATPAPFSTACRSGFWSPATRARSTPTGRSSISSAIAISRNSKRRTGLPRCSATAIRKRWRPRMRARSRSSGRTVRFCSSTGAPKRSHGTARRRR